MSLNIDDEIDNEVQISKDVQKKEKKLGGSPSSP